MTTTAPITDATVHRFLWSKRNSRDLVVCNQKALAGEISMTHIKFHRSIGRLVDDKKLKIVAVGSRGLKTFKVMPLDDTSTADRSSA